MTDKHIFQAQKREIVGKKVSQLRKQGIGVGSISTPKGSSVSIQFSEKAATKLLSSAGESTLIYLTIEGEKKERPVLLDEVQFNPLTQDLYNVSFREVSLKEKVTAAIPVEIIGEVDISDATLVVVVDEVEVEALPTELPEKFEVDVTVLTEIGQMITLADLKFDRSKIELVLGEEQDPTTMPIAMIQAVKEEVEEETPETVIGDEKPEESASEAAPEAKSEEADA